MPGPIARRMALACVAILLVSACGQEPFRTIVPSSGSDAPASPSPTTTSVAPTTSAIATPASTPDRTEGWRSDIAGLIPGMDRIHPDLFHGVSEADLEAAVAELSETVPTATDDELLVGILGIVATVSSPATCDGHTGAFIWGTGAYRVESLPLRLWLFDDKVVVVAALPPYGDMYGNVVTEIEGHPMSEVLAAVEPIIPRDNLMTIRLLTPRYLVIPQVLRGLGLADDGPVSLTLEDPERHLTYTDDVEPISMILYNGAFGEYGLHLGRDEDVPWLARIDDALWWDVLDDGATLFVQHNRVDRLGSTVLGELRTALHDPAIERVVLDLRHNFGGEVSAIDPLVSLFADPAVDQPGKLFVLIGRNTFSAASLEVARLDRDTSATFVGEPMGGCPSLWGNPESFELPFSRIAVSVATEFAVGADPNDTRTTIEPDVVAPPTVEDWRAGIDPAMQLILPVAP